MKRLLAVALLLLASPAFAQRSEFALLAGYTTAGEIEKATRGIQEIKYDGSFSWGLSAGHFFTPHLGAEMSWLRQETGLSLSTSSGSARLVDVNLDQIHGSAVYQFGADKARLRPFVSLGLGASFFGGGDLESQTKLSWGLGAGLKWFPRQSLGARLQIRYNPTRLHEVSSGFCDPFGFCQNSLRQFGFTAGVVLRF
jgi:opacity protein-like surface antigen